ncbi:hypothetical protein TM1040_0898 [Ruegeria sp. TM1040]|nr:hypothetical protein TM1040_0898 [Ruegeria sp. TM1040]
MGCIPYQRIGGGFGNTCGTVKRYLSTCVLLIETGGADETHAFTGKCTCIFCNIGNGFLQSAHGTSPSFKVIDTQNLPPEKNKTREFQHHADKNAFTLH